MWRSDLLRSSIIEYLNSEYINEIIIIDNDPKHKFIDHDHEKIKIISKGENIFVNPSWNLGYELSKNENLIFANDDVFIKSIDLFLSKFLKFDDSIIGLNYNKINQNTEVVIEKTEENICFGFGTFFYLQKKNYIRIPEEFKIFFGDVILYNNTKKRYTFYGPNIQMKMSTTSNSFLNQYSDLEKPIWKEKFSKIYYLK